jgi:hypothetical protein
MTNFDQVWGKSPANCWREVEHSKTYLLAVLPVVAWIGMIGFVFFGALAMLGDIRFASLVSGIFMLIWLAAGIAYIRIRRTQRKLLTVID